MSDVSRAELVARLAELRTAETRILQGQSYSVDGFSLTRANLAEVQEQIRRVLRDIQMHDAAAAAPDGGFARRQPGVSVARRR